MGAIDLLLLLLFWLMQDRKVVVVGQVVMVIVDDNYLHQKQTGRRPRSLADLFWSLLAQQAVQPALFSYLSLMCLLDFVSFFILTHLMTRARLIGDEHHRITVNQTLFIVLLLSLSPDSVSLLFFFTELSVQYHSLRGDLIFTRRRRRQGRRSFFAAAAEVRGGKERGNN